MAKDPIINHKFIFVVNAILNILLMTTLLKVINHNFKSFKLREVLNLNHKDFFNLTTILSSLNIKFMRLKQLFLNRKFKCL